jgi:hypothetical protein
VIARERVDDQKSEALVNLSIKFKNLLELWQCFYLRMYMAFRCGL